MKTESCQTLEKENIISKAREHVEVITWMSSLLNFIKYLR